MAYSTADGSLGGYKQKIGIQKWISLADRGWDAWTEIRRLGYPNIDKISPPIGAASALKHSDCSVATISAPGPAN